MAYTIAPLYDHAARYVPGGRGRGERRVLGGLARATATLRVWLRRADERRHLLDLDERMLADIGIDRPAAIAEAGKPFWRA